MTIRFLRLQHIINYLSTKLAAAGFLVIVIAIWGFFTIGNDYMQFFFIPLNINFWIIVYGYGITCSMIIDLIVFRIPTVNISLRISLFLIKLLLYLIAGLLYFIPFGVNQYLLLTGAIGAICSIIFFLGTIFSESSKVIKYTLFLAPLVVVVVYLGVL